MVDRLLAPQHLENLPGYDCREHAPWVFREVAFGE
jgi:hypothetical protein